MIQDDIGNYTDCNDRGERVAEEGTLINVIFDCEGEDEALQGTLNTHFLPPSVFLVQVTHHRSTGTFNPKDLCECFLALFVNDNNLRGTIAMGNLPITVSEIHIDRNAFQVFFLKSLPKALNMADDDKSFVF